MNSLLSISLAMLWFAAPDAAETGSRLIFLHPVDMAIVVIYFLMVLGIGILPEELHQDRRGLLPGGPRNDGLGCRPEFSLRQPRRPGADGLGGAAYQYGILAAHWYWVGAIPAMLFLGIVMMPFYYISKTHSVPGYLQAALRRTRARAVGRSRSVS